MCRVVLALVSEMDSLSKIGVPGETHEINWLVIDQYVYGS